MGDALRGECDAADSEPDLARACDGQLLEDLAVQMRPDSLRQFFVRRSHTRPTAVYHRQQFECL